MISLRKSIHELETLERIQQATLRCLSEVLRSAGEYPVEFDRGQLDAYRGNMSALRKMLDSPADPETFNSVHSRFRGEVRTYRHQAALWLDRMREEWRAAAEMVQSLSQSVVANDQDHETRLTSDLKKLGRITATARNLDELRASVPQIVASISDSLQQLRSANQLAMVQLRDEIHSLHRALNNQRMALLQDPITGAWNRRRIDDLIGKHLEGGDAFCLILIRIDDLKRIEANRPAVVVESALRQFVGRIKGQIGQEACVGCWSEGEFAVLVEEGVQSALALSSELGRQLSGPYQIQDQESSQYVSLRVTTMVVEQSGGGDADAFRRKLERIEAAAR